MDLLGHNLIESLYETKGPDRPEDQPSARRATSNPWLALLHLQPRPQPPPAPPRAGAPPPTPLTPQPGVPVPDAADQLPRRHLTRQELLRRSGGSAPTVAPAKPPSNNSYSAPAQHTTRGPSHPTPSAPLTRCSSRAPATPACSPPNARSRTGDQARSPQNSTASCSSPTPPESSPKSLIEGPLGHRGMAVRPSELGIGQTTLNGPEGGGPERRLG